MASLAKRTEKERCWVLSRTALIAARKVLRSDRLPASAMPARCFLRSATRALDLKKGA